MRKTREQTETEKALLQRALGFSHEEIYCEDIVDKATGECTGEAKRKIVKKFIPPDVRALLFWLKNRYPDKWRDRIEPVENLPDYNFDAEDEQL